jgi:hypothetical protein
MRIGLVVTVLRSVNLLLRFLSLNTTNQQPKTLITCWTPDTWFLSRYLAFTYRLYSFEKNAFQTFVKKIQVGVFCCLWLFFPLHTLIPYICLKFVSPEKKFVESVFVCEFQNFISIHWLHFCLKFAWEEHSVIPDENRQVIRLFIFGSVYYY